MSNPFSHFHIDVISIFNKNGELLAKNIKSRVDKGNIRTYEVDLIISRVAILNEPCQMQRRNII
jgi:hypothetical protein